MEDKKESYIIMFKPKDKRKDKKSDKTEIFASVTKSDLNFVEPRNKMRIATIPDEEISFDINQYQAPILTASLTKNQVTSLKKHDDIVSVEPDGKVYALGGFEIEGQPSLSASETVPYGIDAVKAPLAWDITKGKGIKVAVVDTGIDYTHPDLKTNYRGGISFVPTETDPKDHNRHGSHVAGTIAASMNGFGVIGVAPSAYLYAVKVLGSAGQGNWSWLIAGLDWCITNKMQVANMSLGSPTAAPTAVESICNLAWENGLILVAAAGNEGTQKPVGYPAKYKSVIAVSAIDSSNVIAPFSCTGPEVEVCAPGVNITSTVPGGGYSSLSGTSMASPHVAGVAALALSTHRWPLGGVPQNVAIRRLLAATSDNLGIPGRDKVFGFGRVDAEESAFSMDIPPTLPGIP